MAVLKTNKYAVTTAAVFEDPIPTSSYIYFQHDAYDKTKLTPQFDTWIQHSTTGTGITTFGYNAGNADTVGGTLMLYGNSATHVNHTIFNTNNDYRNNLDLAPFVSMDTTRPTRWIVYYNDGTNVSVLYTYANIYPGGSAGQLQNFYAYKLNPSTDLTKTLPVLNSTSTTGQYTASYPLYVNPTTKNLIMAGTGGSSNVYMPGWSYGSTFGTLGTAAPTWVNTTNAQNGRSLQFITADTTNYGIFLANNFLNDYDQLIYRWNDSNNTQTTISNPNTAPSAGGSSLGGNRGTASTLGGVFMKTASTTFTDPLLGAGTLGFYLPYFDTAGNYVPFYFQYTVSSATVTRNTNVTVSWGARTQATTWSVDTITAGTTNTVNYGQQRVVHNETFNYTSGGTTTRYLTMMQLHGAGGIYDSYPLMRTFVTFSMNSANPLALTYHSSVTIPVTPKNIVWLNSTKTILGVFAANYFFIYSFTAASGWTLTGQLPYTYWAVGTDSTGRIWAVDKGLTGQGQIHLLTLSVPVTVSVTPAQTSYNYTGTTISSTLAVSAYDQTGSRIATLVKLVIDGGSMTFGGSNLTTTITTSTSADVSVAISITDGGYSNIIASVVLS